MGRCVSHRLLQQPQLQAPPRQGRGRFEHRRRCQAGVPGERTTSPQTARAPGPQVVVNRAAVENAVQDSIFPMGIDRHPCGPSGAAPTTALRERNPRTGVVVELAVRRVEHIGVARRGVVGADEATRGKSCDHVGAPITTYLRGASARQSAAHLRSHCDLVIRSPRVDILTAETGSATTRRCWQQAYRHTLFRHCDDFYGQERVRSRRSWPRARPLAGRHERSRSGFLESI